MSAQQQHSVWTAYVSATDGDIEVGHCLMLNAAGTRYVPATLANRTAAGRSSCGGIALTARSEDDRDRSVEVQTVGPCPPTKTLLGSGADNVPIIVGDDGFLERKASPDPGDIVVGKCDADGWAYLNFSTQGAQGADGEPGPPGDSIALDANPGELLMADEDATGAVGIPLGDEGDVYGVVGGVNTSRPTAEIEAGTVGHMAGYATVDGDLEDIGVVPSVTAGTNVTVDVLANNVYRVNSSGGGGAYATFEETTTDENASVAYTLDTSELEDGTYNLKVRVIGDAGVDGSDEAHLVIEKRAHFMVRSGAAVSMSEETLIYADSMPADFEPATVNLTFAISSGDIAVSVVGEEATTIDWTGEVMLGIGLALTPGTGWGTPGGGAPAWWGGVTPIVSWNAANAEHSDHSGTEKVDVLIDDSGNGNDATAESGHEPHFDSVSTNYGNKPTMLFPNGNQPRIPFGDVGIPVDGPFTVMIIGQTDGGAANRRYLCSTGAELDIYSENLNGHIQAVLSDSSQTLTSTVDGSDQHVIMVTLSGGTQTLYIDDGATASAIDSDSSSGCDATSGGQVGTHAGFPTNDLFTNSGEIAAIVIWDVALNESQRIAAITAAQTEWGL